MKNKFKSRAFEAAVAAAIAAASAIFIFSCGNPAVEKADELVKQGSYEAAVKTLEAAPAGQLGEKGSALLKRAKELLESKKKEELRNAALERFKLAGEAKNGKEFDKLMTLANSAQQDAADFAEAKEKAAAAFLGFLTSAGGPDDYVEAVKYYKKFIAGHPANQAPDKPRVRVFERKMILSSPEGNKKVEELKDEIPIGDNKAAIEMFDWLVSKNADAIANLDRYARFMFKIELYEEAAAAFDKLATGYPAAPYEIVSKAQKMAVLAKERAESAKKKTPVKTDKAAARDVYYWKDEAPGGASKETKDGKKKK